MTSPNQQYFSYLDNMASEFVGLLPEQFTTQFLDSFLLAHGVRGLNFTEIILLIEPVFKLFHPLYQKLRIRCFQLRPPAG